MNRAKGSAEQKEDRKKRKDAKGKKGGKIYYVNIKCETLSL
jgi:hypothetical protein